MKIPNKNVVLLLFKYMYVTLITVTALGFYVDYHRALLGLAVYIFMLLCSEMPLRAYYMGKPLLRYGSFIDSKTEEETLENLWFHLITMLIGTILIIFNIVYLFATTFVNWN